MQLGTRRNKYSSLEARAPLTRVDRHWGGGPIIVRALVALAMGLIISLPFGAAGAQTVPSFSNAFEVNGTASLNASGDAGIDQISCPSDQNCSAVGYYLDANQNYQGFVVDKVNGTWGTAETIPGLESLNAGGDVDNLVISCSSAGNCAAGGSYEDADNDTHAFVVSEVNGTWGTAIAVPGFSVIGTNGLLGEITTIFCTANGDCSAGGSFGDVANKLQAFVVNETNGTWGTAQEIPGLASLNAGGVSATLSVSCTSNGNCVAGGTYSSGSSTAEAFVASESDGTWGNAIEVPGTATLNVGGGALVDVVSCVSSGECEIGGIYAPTSSTIASFVDSESGGQWETASPLTGVTVSSSYEILTSLDCTGSGACTAAGSYGSTSIAQGFTADEVNGTWYPTQDVPGLESLNAGNQALIEDLACTLPGTCTAGGYYTDASGNAQAFTASETGGAWKPATELEGSAALNTGGSAVVNSVACSVDGSCSVGGAYEDGSQNNQAMLADSPALFSTPSKPGIKLASTAKGGLTVTVVTPATTNGYPVTAYQYSLNGGAWKNVPGLTATRFTVEHLKSGDTYRVAVRASNLLGDGSSSSASVKVK